MYGYKLNNDAIQAKKIVIQQHPLHIDDIDFVRTNAEVDEKTVDEQIALSDAGVRKEFISTILNIFIKANIGTISIIVVCILIDLYFQNKPVSGYERLIDAKVIIALLGATTVQLGTIMVIITRAIFPKGVGSGE